MSETYHAKAKCRWCGGRFRKVFGYQWGCENAECFERCKAAGVLDSTGEKYLFLPLPFQVEIEEYPVRRLLVHGAAGVSKSYFGRWYAYKRCRQIPGFRVLLLRCTYDQLMKNHLQYIPDESKLLGFKWTGLSGQNARQAQFKHGENEPDAILFMGYCQDVGDIDQHVGPEWDLVLLEEGVTLLPKAIREISARDRGAATSRPYREAIGLKGQTRILTNPGGRSMIYLKDFYIDKTPDHLEYRDYKPEYYAQISGGVPDNPYLEEDYQDASLGHLDATRHAQLAEGRWDVFENQMFPSFNRAIHVAEMEPL